MRLFRQYRCTVLVLLLLLAAMSSAQQDDYYKVLGVPRTATQRDIKKKYRALARKLHPDLNLDDPHAKDTFQRVNKAYDTLGDAEKRKTYDLFGEAGDSMGGGGGDSRGGSGGGGFAGGPHGGGGGGMPFTGTHFDSFFRFQKPKKASRKSSGFASSSSASSFSFQKAFGSSIYKETPQTDGTAQKGSGGGGWFDSLFSNFGGGNGAAATQKDDSSSSKKKSTAKKAKRSAADFASDENIRHKASTGQKPTHEDFADLGEGFFGTDAPPRDMFEDKTSLPTEESPEFMTWFEQKFGAGPSGATSGPTKRQQRKKKKQQTAVSEQDHGIFSSNGDSTHQQKAKARKKKSSKPSAHEGPSSFFNQNGGNPFDPSGFQQDQKTKQQLAKEAAAKLRLDFSTLHLFSFDLFNQHCAAPDDRASLRPRRQRCIVIFGATTTYLSANVTFRKTVEKFHTAERRRDLLAARHASSTATASTLFLFVPKSDVANTTVLLQLRIFRAAAAPSALRLCEAYGASQRQQHLTGEYCVLAVRPARSGKPSESDKRTGSGGASTVPAALRKVALFGQGVADAESALAAVHDGAPSLKKTSRSVRSAQDLQRHVLDAMEGGEAKWLEARIEPEEEEEEATDGKGRA